MALKSHYFDLTDLKLIFFSVLNSKSAQIIRGTVTLVISYYRFYGVIWYFYSSSFNSQSLQKSSLELAQLCSIYNKEC